MLIKEPYNSGSGLLVDHGFQIGSPLQNQFASPNSWPDIKPFIQHCLSNCTRISLFIVRNHDEHTEICCEQDVFDTLLPIKQGSLCWLTEAQVCKLESCEMKAECEGCVLSKPAAVPGLTHSSRLREHTLTLFSQDPPGRDIQNTCNPA